MNVTRPGHGSMFTLQMVLAVLKILSQCAEFLWVQVQTFVQEKEQVAGGRGNSVALQLAALQVVLRQLSRPCRNLRGVQHPLRTAQAPELHQHKLHGLFFGHISMNCGEAEEGSARGGKELTYGAQCELLQSKQCTQEFYLISNTLQSGNHCLTQLPHYNSVCTQKDTFMSTLEYWEKGHLK